MGERTRKNGLTKVHDERSRPRRSRRACRAGGGPCCRSRTTRACLREPSRPSALTQAPGGGARVVGEVAAHVAWRLTGGLSGRASSQVMSHDEAEHVLLGSSPEVVTSQRTQSKHSDDSCIACWTEGGSGNERFVSCQVRDLGAASVDACEPLVFIASSSQPHVSMCFLWTGNRLPPTCLL